MVDENHTSDESSIDQQAHELWNERDPTSDLRYRPEEGVPEVFQRSDAYDVHRGYHWYTVRQLTEFETFGLDDVDTHCVVTYDTDHEDILGEVFEIWQDRDIIYLSDNVRLRYDEFVDETTHEAFGAGQYTWNASSFWIEFTADAGHQDLRRLIHTHEQIREYEYETNIDELETEVEDLEGDLETTRDNLNSAQRRAAEAESRVTTYQMLLLLLVGFLVFTYLPQFGF